MECPVKSKRKLSIYNIGVRVGVGNIFLGSDLWPAICFKIMTRYTCDVLPRIFAIFCPVGYFPSMCSFSSHASVSTQTYAKQTPIYLRYKQTCIWGHSRSSQEASNYTVGNIATSCIIELKRNFSVNHSWPR